MVDVNKLFGNGMPLLLALLTSAAAVVSASSEHHYNLTECAVPFLLLAEDNVTSCQQLTYAEEVGPPYSVVRVIFMSVSAVTFVLGVLRCLGICDRLKKTPSSLNSPSVQYKSISHHDTNSREDLSGVHNIARRFQKLRGDKHQHFWRYRRSLLPRVCLLALLLIIFFYDPLGYTTLMPIKVWSLFNDVCGILSGSIALSAAYAWIRISASDTSELYRLRIGHRIAQLIVWLGFPIPSILLLAIPSVRWWQYQVAGASLYLFMSAMVTLVSLSFSISSWQQHQESKVQAHRFVDAPDILRRRGRSEVAWRNLFAVTFFGFILLAFWISRAVDLNLNKYGIDAGDVKKPLATSFGGIFMRCLTHVASIALSLIVLAAPGLFEDPDLRLFGDY